MKLSYQTDRRYVLSKIYDHRNCDPGAELTEPMTRALAPVYLSSQSSKRPGHDSIITTLMKCRAVGSLPSVSACDCYALAIVCHMGMIPSACSHDAAVRLIDHYVVVISRFRQPAEVRRMIIHNAKTVIVLDSCPNTLSSRPTSYKI